MKRGRHERCPVKESYGMTEYDAHPHQCTLVWQHTGEHDFSQCPEGRSLSNPSRHQMKG